MLPDHEQFSHLFETAYPNAHSNLHKRHTKANWDLLNNFWCSRVTTIELCSQFSRRRSCGYWFEYRLHEYTRIISRSDFSDKVTSTNLSNAKTIHPLVFGAEMTLSVLSRYVNYEFHLWQFCYNSAKLFADNISTTTNATVQDFYGNEQKC